MRPIRRPGLCLWLLAALPLIGGCGMTQSSGASFRGPLPAMSHEEAQLAGRLRGHVQTLAGDIGDRNVWRHDELNAAAAYASRVLRDAGYDVRDQPYEAGGRTVKNLEVELKGGANADEVFVVGAHYDSVRGCPGANDNGTGVAAVLEMARAMAADRPARTVRFVLFVNEEPPFFHTDAMGSLVYARACRARGDRVVGMMSVETIGFYSDAPGSQRYPAPFDRMFPSTGNFIGFVADERSAPFLDDVMAAFRRHAKFPSEGLAAPDTVEGVGWSDHWSFWRQGYPALMVTDTAPFRYPHYHHPTDTPDKVDYDRCARVVAGLIAVTRELASGAAS